jgi:hypothetical protein
MTGEIVPSGSSQRSAVGSPMSFVELSAHLRVDAMPTDRSLGRSACGQALTSFGR